MAVNAIKKIMESTKDVNVDLRKIKIVKKMGSVPVNRVNVVSKLTQISGV